MGIRKKGREEKKREEEERNGREEREAAEDEEEEGMGERRQRRRKKGSEGREATIGDIDIDAVFMLFLGRLGKHELAGGSLSIGFANVTGYSILSGLALGIEPISSQAICAKKYSLMCLTLQRTILILLVVCLPIFLIWLKMKPILLLCCQDPIITFVASTYRTFSFSPSSSLAPLFFPRAFFFSFLSFLLLLPSLPSSSSLISLPFPSLPFFLLLPSLHFLPCSSSPFLPN